MTVETHKPSELINNIDQLEKIADVFSLLGDLSRLRIVLCCINGERNVSDIAESLSLSQPLVSHHLRLLKAAKMLKSTRRGKHIFYAAADEHVRHIISDMTIHLSESHC